jgi:hypothetical protein
MGNTLTIKRMYIFCDLNFLIVNTRQIYPLNSKESIFGYCFGSVKKLILVINFMIGISLFYDPDNKPYTQCRKSVNPKE